MWKCGQAKCSPVTLRMFLRCVHHMRKLVHTLDLRRSMCTIPWNPPCTLSFQQVVGTFSLFSMSWILGVWFWPPVCNRWGRLFRSWVVVDGGSVALHRFCPHAFCEKSFPREFRWKKFLPFLEDICSAGRFEVGEPHFVQELALQSAWPLGDTKCSDVVIHFAHV